MTDTTRADVAIGPVYFCATAAASPDLCDVAVAELTDVVVADALVVDPAPLAEITGLLARLGIEVRVTGWRLQATIAPAQKPPVGQRPDPRGR